MVSDGPKPYSDPAVVLVHGLGLSHRYMMPTARALARDFPVYVPDLPGFGDSDHPPRALGISGLADALRDWMQAAGIGRAALLGNSHGCQIIIDVAARHPERVSRAILQAPTTQADERSWFWQFIRWRQNSRFRALERSRPAWRDYRKAGFYRILRTLQYALHDRPEDKAPRIQVPTLLLVGQYDPICREHWAEHLARLMPNGRVAVLLDVAHTLGLTASEGLAAVTREFLLQDPI